tara:strand:- start:1763 stop:4378 length:2616 start_codon:yes stop_codon:yes gene_type:complete
MTSIKLKKSSVAGKIPTDSDLAHGELAINFQDGKLFYKDASNNVKAFIDSAAVGSLITAGQGLDSDGVKSVHFGDNEKLTFGNDSDFKIFHDGTRTILHDEGTGEIQVRTSQFRIRNPGNTETLAKFVQDGAVELFHGMSGSAAEKKFETTSKGIDVTGRVSIPDGSQTQNNLVLGNDSDFFIYHSGQTVIANKNGSGPIKIQGKFGEQSIVANQDGAVELYEDGSKKFETTDSGVNITGNLRINNAPADFGLDSTNVINIIDSDYVLNRSGISIPVLSEDSSLAFNQRLSFQAQTTSGVLEVQPRMSVLDSAGTETLVNVNFVGGGGTDSAAVIALIDSAYVQARETPFPDSATFNQINIPDGGLTGNRINVGTHDDLKIYHSGTHSFIREVGTGHLYITTNGDFIHLGNGGALQSGKFSPAGAAELFYNGARKFQTTDSGATVTGSITADSAVLPTIFLDSDGYADRPHISRTGGSGYTKNIPQITTTAGTLGIGPANSAFSHFITDRAKYYFNKRINVDEGIITSYDEDLQLQRVNVTRVTLTDSGATVTGRLRADSATISGMRFPTADGDANQAIITDGAGNLTFGTVSGGGGGSGGVAGTTNAATAQSFVGDSSTTTFTMTGAVPSDSDDVLVFINGILQHTDNYSLSGNALTLDSAPHTGDKIETRKLAVRSTNVSLRDYRNYIYTTTGSSTTTFSGADSSGTSLAYDVGKLEVYLNGSRLVNGKDYTATNGTSVVLDSAVSAGNIVEVVSLAAAAIENPGILAVDSDLTSTDSGQVIHSFDRAAFRTVKYIVQLEHDSDNKYHSEEILLSHNNTIVGMTTYAQLLLDSNLGTFDADISGTDVRLKVTPTKTNTSVKLRAIRVGA